MSSSISLTNAVTSGDERAVSALLANGVDVNESTSGGQSALILAVIFGHTNLVRVLVKAGADPQLRDNLGLNAIEWAKRRGSSEALEILTRTFEFPPPKRKTVAKTEEPERSVVETPPTQPDVDIEVRESVSDEEKSRRWLAGLRQRLDEQEVRRLNQSESAPEPPLLEPEPVLASVLPKLTNRKRCPKCNAIYNGDLVSYCATDVVPLVDVDAPATPEPPAKANSPLFWIMVVITLVGSLIMGSLITTYLYKSNQADARSAAPQQNTIQKGVPELGGNLVGKGVSLPEAEFPVSGPQPTTGTVVVNVKVDKKGQVYWARGSGGDWLMRGASTEAAMKSTFSPEKLRGREAEGTITYTFKP